MKIIYRKAIKLFSDHYSDRGFVVFHNFLVEKLQRSLADRQKPSENIVDIIKEGKKPLSIKDGAIVSIYAKDLGDPRVLQFAPGGSLFVSSPGEGKIYALIDSNNDGVAEENRIVAENLNDPHGFAFKCEAQEGEKKNARCISPRRTRFRSLILTR